jgi:hypothetical protein
MPPARCTRSSMSHIYSHCVVIHFAAYAPSTLWPKGIAACSHPEWVVSCALVERKASRWRKLAELVTIYKADPDLLRRYTPKDTPTRYSPDADAIVLDRGRRLVLRRAVTVPTRAWKHLHLRVCKMARSCQLC